MKPSNVLPIALTLTLLAPVALAAGQATLETADDGKPMTMNLRWSDDNLRMDFPSQQDGYLLMRDGKGYLITRQQGHTVVMDMAMLKGMADAMGADAAGYRAQQAESVEGLEATGEHETVAGLDGEVYRLTWTDRSGKRQTDDVVLSDDPLAVELLGAFQSYVNAVMNEPDPIGTTLLDRQLGMLRFGDKFELVSIDATAPAADAFAMPQNAMSMQDMLKGLGKPSTQ